MEQLRAALPGAGAHQHQGLAGMNSMSIDDFEVIKPISRGAFGRVYLARKRTTGDLYAIKVGWPCIASLYASACSGCSGICFMSAIICPLLGTNKRLPHIMFHRLNGTEGTFLIHKVVALQVMRKADLVRKNMVASVRNERNILALANNPFVVRFYYSFTSRDNLYIVMEYVPGGDAFSLLRSLGYLDEEAARLYVAEAVLALEYCHTQVGGPHMQISCLAGLLLQSVTCVRY